MYGRVLTRRADLGFLVLAQLQVQRAKVFGNAIDVRGPGNLLTAISFYHHGSRLLCDVAMPVGSTYREDVMALCKQPGERQLRRGRALFLCQLRDRVDELEVLGEVLVADWGGGLAVTQQAHHEDVGNLHRGLCFLKSPSSKSLLDRMVPANMPRPIGE